MKKMRTKLFDIQQIKLFILLLDLFILTPSYLVTESTSKTMDKTVYVWDFTTRDYKKNHITSNFTYDFEAALVQSGCFKVLERRNYDRLIAQIDNEKAIAEISNISSSTFNNLKSLQADMVIFGEVFDDVDSGEIKITFKLQALDSSIVLMESIRISRGKINDAESREKAMKKLMGKICKPPPNESFGKLGEVKKQEINTPIIESIDERGILLIELGFNIYAYGLGFESIPGQLDIDDITFDLKDIYVRLGLPMPNVEIGPKMAEITYKTLATERDRDCLAIGLYLSSAYSVGLVIINHRGTEFETMGEKKIMEIIHNLKIRLQSLGILNKVEEKNEFSSVIFPKKQDSVDSYSKKLFDLKASIKGNFRDTYKNRRD